MRLQSLSRLWRKNSYLCSKSLIWSRWWRTLEIFESIMVSLWVNILQISFLSLSFSVSFSLVLPFAQLGCSYFAFIGKVSGVSAPCVYRFWGKFLSIISCKLRRKEHKSNRSESETQHLCDCRWITLFYPCDKRRTRAKMVSIWDFRFINECRSVAKSVTECAKKIQLIYRKWKIKR